MRDLDQQIEDIELASRARIAETLGDDPARLPPHVNQKAEERIQTATKKNAAIEPEQYKHIRRGLEYCDLRELQDTILIKAIWSEYEKRFANKETHAGGREIPQEPQVHHRRIEKLRLLLRLAADLTMLDRRRYEHAARALDETGRLIGGWMRAHGPSASEVIGTKKAATA